MGRLGGNLGALPAYHEHTGNRQCLRGVAAGGCVFQRFPGADAEVGTADGIDEFTEPQHGYARCLSLLADAAGGGETAFHPPGNRGQYPALRFACGEYFGFEAEIFALLEQRIEEAGGMS